MNVEVTKGRKVRYAAVAAGWISQGYFMPGVEHTGNSELVAVVTSDPVKAAALTKRYRLQATYDYAEFDRLLASSSIDAIYLATPNFMHTDFAIRALRRGIHVLLEKPMAIREPDCQRIQEAAKESGAKLMIAYRLHFEPATLAALSLVRSGELGEVLWFDSTFSQKLRLDNHRAKNGFEAGPVYDMGPYPINAARNLFGAEPIEVSATASRHPELGFGDLDDTVSATLRFAGDRLATFVVSYATSAMDRYTLLGTKAAITMEPAYLFGKPLQYTLSVGGKQHQRSFPNTDHFGGETCYFSACILDGVDPEPDGEEGRLDVRVIEAIRRSLETGTPQKLPLVARHKQIELKNVQQLAAVKVPELVNAASPAAEG